MYTHLSRKKIPNHPHLPQKSNGHICGGCATFHWTKFLQVSDGLWKSIFMSAVMNYKGKPGEIYSTLRNSFRTFFFQLILFPEFSVEWSIVPPSTQKIYRFQIFCWRLSLKISTLFAPVLPHETTCAIFNSVSPKHNVTVKYEVLLIVYTRMKIVYNVFLVRLSRSPVL